MLRRIVFTPNITRKITTVSTVDRDEILHLEKHCEGWWDPQGNMKPLHSMNKVRVPFIRDGLTNAGAVGKKNALSPQPLKGLAILEVGCGGGILSEPLARLGAEVTGIDAGSDMVKLAKKHSEQSNLKITYECASVEQHSEANREKYDAVVASEVIEHVTEKDKFISSCADCVKPKGSIFITTISKTFWSQWLAIYAVENVFKLMPQGTHQYEKFIESHKLQRLLEDYQLRTTLIHGMFYNVFTNKWSWCSNTSLSYGIQAMKI